MCGQMGLEAKHTDTSRNSQPPLQHITALHADTYRNTNMHAVVERLMCKLILINLPYLVKIILFFLMAVFSHSGDLRLLLKIGLMINNP